jgi:hypothetical protein
MPVVNGAGRREAEKKGVCPTAGFFSFFF